MTTDSVLVSPEQLSALMGTEPVVIIDTRDADTYAAGHIPGAVNLREIFTFLATSTAEGLQRAQGHLCRSTSARSACRARKPRCSTKTRSTAATASPAAATTC